ncbi:MAG: family 10 glycosylhydrolase [Armatimonadetes bacterium]|nr:family 10 glycosylhydrolase [Armatimonadota bacterium]
MRHRYTTALVLLFAALLPTPAPADEFRSILVDAWYWASGYAIVSPTATQDTVDRIKSWNCNVILMQVRKRCDAYYISSLEPTGTQPSPDPGYDPLADMVAKAHAQGMEVHTWVVPYRAWTYATPPPHTTPEQVYYLHPEWLSQYANGDTLWDGRYSSLDPGIPAVEDYLIGVFMDIVQRYDIDGFMLDYIRYYNTAWGYNPTAVARFNAEYGRTGLPSSTDPVWCQWRRDQVSNLVKRLYLEVKSVKPQLKVGALVWKTAASGYSDVLQDWDRWMTNHWLDYTSPMNYTGDNATFHTNALDSLSRGYGHHIYMGMSGSENPISTTIWQIEDEQSIGFPGMHFYNYAQPDAGMPNQDGFRDALLAGPFPTQVSVPAMPWLITPTKGFLKGFIRDEGGAAVYPATATVVGLGLSDKNSGTGFYGFSEVAPGTYTVRVTSPGCIPAERQVTITAGQVASLDFTLVRDSVAPVISNVRAENVQGTHAQIKWDTDDESTSQVEYGPTTAYGAVTAEDMLRATSHSVQLVDLTPLTTYHFRVRSYDAARNVAESSDYTFTTTAGDLIPDIVIDNLDPGCSTYGTWWTGSIAGKYGTDYYYATTADPTRYATFTPTILSAGFYDVYIWYTQSSNRSAQAKWRVYCDGGMQESRVNEQVNGGKWVLLAVNKPFSCGSAGYVATYSDTGDTSTMVIIADAVKFVFEGITIPAAKRRPNGSEIVLIGKVASACFGDHFYICEGREDQVSGIRVSGTPPAEGSLVDVSGTLNTMDGERVLIFPTIAASVGPGAPEPLFMVGRAVGGGRLNDYTDGVAGGIGLNNIGLLISTIGAVTFAGTGYFYVDDGSGVTDNSGHLGVKALGTAPIGKHVRLTGISSCFESGTDVYRQIEATQVTLLD